MGNLALPVGGKCKTADLAEADGGLGVCCLTLTAGNGVRLVGADAQLLDALQQTIAQSHPCLDVQCVASHRCWCELRVRVRRPHGVQHRPTGRLTRTVLAHLLCDVCQCLARLHWHLVGCVQLGRVRQAPSWLFVHAPHCQCQPSQSSVCVRVAHGCSWQCLHATPALCQVVRASAFWKTERTKTVSFGLVHNYTLRQLTIKPCHSDDPVEKMSAPARDVLSLIVHMAQAGYCLYAIANTPRRQPSLFFLQDEQARVPVGALCRLADSDGLLLLHCRGLAPTVLRCIKRYWPGVNVKQQTHEQTNTVLFEWAGAWQQGDVSEAHMFWLRLVQALARVQHSLAGAVSVGNCELLPLVRTDAAFARHVCVLPAGLDALHVLDTHAACDLVDLAHVHSGRLRLRHYRSAAHHKTWCVSGAPWDGAWTQFSVEATNLVNHLLRQLLAHGCRLLFCADLTAGQRGVLSTVHKRLGSCATPLQAMYFGLGTVSRPVEVEVDQQLTELYEEIP